jgi:hypothetical protein
MRTPYRVVVALAALSVVPACETLAGLEDLELTAGAPDATVEAAGSPDGNGPASETGPEAVDSGPDIVVYTTDAAGSDSGVDAADTPDSGAANTVDATNDADAANHVDATTVEAGVTYAQVVLSDAPLAYWRVDETVGLVAHDVTGNGHDAIYVGGFTLGAGGALIGDSDTAVTFDGKTGHLDANDVLAFTGNTPFTLEAWAAPQALTVDYQRLFARESSAGQTRDGYLMFLRTGAADPSTFGFERWSDGGQSTCHSTSAVPSGWHHFVATFDGATSSIYVDGVLYDAAPASAPLVPVTEVLWVGASTWDPAAYFQGSVDELAVYGVALSQDRITAHFQASGR